MPKEVKFIIRAIDKTKEGIASVGRGLDTLGTRAKSITNSISAGFTNIGKSLFSLRGLIVGGGGIASAFQFLKASVQTAFKFERFETQFKTLLGSVEKAKARIKELATFTAKTPFQLDEVVQASRQLEVFTRGALSAGDGLIVIGDAAAGVNVPLQEVAFWVGRAYDAIQNGQPFGEAAMRLQEMGLLSGVTRLKMEQLQKAGKGGADVWRILNQELKKFEGGMADLSATGDGLISNIQDEWDQILLAFGNTVRDDAKGSLKELLETMTELRESGAITQWGENTIAVVERVATSVVGLLDLYDKLKTFSAPGFGPLGLPKMLNALGDAGTKIGKQGMEMLFGSKGGGGSGTNVPPVQSPSRGPQLPVPGFGNVPSIPGPSRPSISLTGSNVNLQTNVIGGGPSAIVNGIPQDLSIGRGVNEINGQLLSEVKGLRSDLNGQLAIE